MSLTLPVVTSAAIIDSLNPCAISVLLLTIGFLMSLHKTRRQVFTIAGIYIFGIFITYIFIGLGILQTLTIFGIPKVLSKVGALIIILTGTINLIGHFYPKFPIKLVIPKFTKPGIAKLMTKASYPAIFALGVLVGLFEFPCTGGPYLLILSLLHDHTTFKLGALYLVYYNFIFVLPLVIILAVSGNKTVVDKFQNIRKNRTRIVDTISSVAMIILGVVIFLL